MSDPDNEIALNRADLLGLCELLNKVLPREADTPPSAAGFAAGWSACVRAITEIAEKMPTGVLVSRQLLEEFVDAGECWFDHHGGCQGHGYELEPGEVCPQAQLKMLLAGSL